MIQSKTRIHLVGTTDTERENGLFAPNYPAANRKRYLEVKRATDRNPFDADAEFDLAIEDKLRIDALMTYYHKTERKNKKAS